MEIDSKTIIQIIAEAINTLFSNLFSSIDNNLYSILDDITFINSDILNNSYFENILGTNSSNGILLIANSLIIGFVLYYGISLVFSYLAFSNIQRPIQFIFKLIIITIIMNFSYFFCEQIISLNSNISLGIRQVGENIFKKNICFSTLIEELNFKICTENIPINIFSLDGLIKSFVSIGLLGLIISYSLRYFMIKIFILISPFAILTLCNENSNWFFNAWLKSFLSLLFMQILISLILVLSFSFNFSKNDIFSKLMYIASIYSLLKCNAFVREFMGGISTNIGANISNIKSMFNVR